MPEPIRVPISEHQKARLAGFEKDAKSIQDQANAAIAKINERLSDSVTAIVAVQLDTELLFREKWALKLDGDAIICTPPEVAPDQPAEPPSA